MLAEYSRCDTGAVRILFVEDDFQLLAATARGLRNSGFAVDVADRGEDALAKTAVTEYDVVVLDRDLPGMHGDDVCRSIAAGSAQILMLTAFDSLDDRVAGLGLGLTTIWSSRSISGSSWRESTRWVAGRRKAQRRCSRSAIVGSTRTNAWSIGPTE